MVKKAILIAALIALFFSLSGCETLQGLGRDIEWVGQKLGGE